VSRAEEPLDLGRIARQGRLVLAYLALDPRRAVAREELIDRVWPCADPGRAGAALSQTLSRLRQALGRDLIERLPGGAVRLGGPLRVDVAVARDAVEEAREAVRIGAWTAARDAARTVTAELERGVVLAGDEAEWLEDVRREVAELHVEALELVAAAALRMGAWADALAAARGAVRLDRLRQSAWALLIEAQAGQGDVAGATRSYHDLRSLLLDEAGLTPSPDLIELHRRVVTGELSSAGAVAFPPALALESGGAAFVGREDGLRRLGERYADACAGTRQLVVLSGEPGIGKTRLAGEFARRAHDEGAIVLYGRSDDETLVPFQPFVGAIGHYVGECGDAALARELGPELGELGRLIPGLAARAREPLAVEPEMQRFRLFNAVTSVLAHVARGRPAIVVLDDLQWADRSTALLLRHVIREIDAVQLLMIGTLRDVEACRSEQLAEFLARPQHGVDTIALRGLDADETQALVVARAGRRATAGAVGALLEATGGNPLLLEETIRSLGDVEQAVHGFGVPERAAQVIGRRVVRLSEPAQRALAGAAVAGAEFDVRVVEAVAGEQALDGIEEAAAAGLVRELPDGRFSFSHALVRDALRERLSGARRQRLHLRIGEALDALGDGNPAELAHHFSEGGDAAKALEHSVQAGEQAAEALAHEDAAGHFRRALELLPAAEERRRCELLLALGRVELRQGGPDARPTFRAASQLAGRLGEPELLGQAALGFASRYPEAGVVDEDGISLLEEARAAGCSPALRAELTARLADSLHFAPEVGEAERLSAEALAVAREVGDQHALAAALESRHAALLSIEHLDERLRLSQELIDLAVGVGERELEALGRHWRIYDLLEAAWLDEARRERQALDALVEELRQPLYQHFSVGWAVVWAQLAGEVEEIEPLAERFYALGVEAQARDTETIHRAQLMALRRRQERLADFVETVRSAVEAHPNLLAWRAALPLAHLASGDLRAAVAEFEWFAQDGFARVRRDMFWFPTICALAETCALLRDAERAQVLYDLLEPYQARNVQLTQAACWGSAERFVGLLAAVLGRFDAAVAHFEAAIAKNEADGNLPSASLVRRDLAKLLLVRRGAGDLDRAAQLLDESLRAARTPSLITRIEAEIEAVERERRATVR
jgi:DNA-binding SARP family transcriptional activator/tetratricopeptide (TPR) repeat protein